MSNFYYRKFLSLIILITLFYGKTSLAFKFTEKVCQEYGLGKNWYCETEKLKNKEDDFNNTITAQDILDSKLKPEEQAILLNELWEMQRKRAVITEDKKEIEKFLITHNLIAAKGIDFARNVQKLIETSPKFITSESYYKNIAESQIREEQRDQVLKNAHKRYGLVFIYNTNCKHCIRQFPIIEKLKEKYKLRVIGITIDDNYFAGLDENITDVNIANDPMVQAFPTILLLDKKLPTKIFIAKGLTTVDELEKRIAARIREHEHEHEDNQKK